MTMRMDDWDDQPDVITYADAVKDIRNLDFCLSQKFLDQQMRAVRDGAHPDILEFERVLIRRMRKLGVPMFAHCVMRGDVDQMRAYVSGHSNARPGESPHNHGCAVDIIHGTRAWSIPRKSWEVVGHVGKEVSKAKGIPIVWGGDFKRLWDPAHWELANWRVRMLERA